LVQIRDEIAPTFQSQLDEIAKGLVSLFSESDGSTTKPGLFIWSSGTTPTGSGVIKGIAASIQIAGGTTGVITSEGGDPMRLRDGGINGTAYDENLLPTKSSGYTDRLDALYTSMNSDIDFDPSTGVIGFDTSTGIDSHVSILNFASNSIGWIEQYRSDATTASENTSAALSRSDEAYSNETGVNLDEELTLLLDIEQSYKAATKILNAVDEMMKSLLDIAS
jgi:flagellar hook-associated protein 1 FlgK